MNGENEKNTMRIIVIQTVIHNERNVEKRNMKSGNRSLCVIPAEAGIQISHFPYSHNMRTKQYRFPSTRSRTTPTSQALCCASVWVSEKTILFSADGYSGLAFSD